MPKPKKDNVSSLTRHRETVDFSLDNHPEGVKWRWKCSCGVKGQWYNRAYRRWYMFTLWQAHVKRRHPEYSTDIEDLDNEGEGL